MLFVLCHLCFPLSFWFSPKQESFVGQEKTTSLQHGYMIAFYVSCSCFLPFSFFSLFRLFSPKKFFWTRGPYPPPPCVRPCYGTNFSETNFLSFCIKIG